MFHLVLIIWGFWNSFPITDNYVIPNGFANPDREPYSAVAVSESTQTSALQLIYPDRQSFRVFFPSPGRKVNQPNPGTTTTLRRGPSHSASTIDGPVIEWNFSFYAPATIKFVFPKCFRCVVVRRGTPFYFLENPPQQSWAHFGGTFSHNDAQKLLWFDWLGHVQLLPLRVCYPKCVSLKYFQKIFTPMIVKCPAINHGCDCAATTTNPSKDEAKA